MSIFNNVVWIQASALTLLTALSMSDVIISRPYAHPAIVPAVIRPCAEKPFVFDLAEDRAYWSAKYGRDLTEAEHLEIRSNLVGFIRALMAPSLHNKTPSESGLQ